MVLIILFLLIFLFLSSCLHRDLHSFPTRRSSDLPSPCRAHSAWCACSSGSGSRWPSPCPGRVAPGAADYRAPEQAQDRKSTRLNSSHSSISYAVFCLKKKNKVRVFTY